MFLNPEQCIAQFGLKEGMRVADFGAGSGSYTRAASLRVGFTGRVYAIEVQKELVEKLDADIKEWKLLNTEVIWGDIEKNGGTKLADGSMDAVIVSNVLFQVADKLGLIDEAKRVLKSDGKVLVVDWLESFGNIGPTPSHVITAKMAQDLFEKRGFKYVETISPGPQHYGIILSR
jgi:ubiquinone/menaquinone biosynthesis C-methylase UbiE